jgi:hypothetical protein
MKKIAFILSLLVFSGGFTSAQANGTLDIDKTYLTKISLAESEYATALAKWKEIDQVKITNDSLRVSKVDVTFFNSRFGLVTITLSDQDQNRRPGPPQAVLGKILSGTTNCCAFGSIPGGRDSIYELVAPGHNAGYQEFSWDLEQEYSPSIHMSTAAQAISAFQQGWMWSVKQDGTKVSFSEFETTRGLVKSAYANIKTLRSEYTKAINNYYAEQAKAMQKAMEEADAKAREEADAKAALEQREQWAKETNKYLYSYFPAKAKSNLIKQGYFKPLKTTSYTYETGRYIANARVSGNTATVTGYWETKTVYDVPTKKEQANWIKESNNKLNQVIKQYSTLVAEAKIRGYAVVCAPNVPCKVLF